MSETTRTPHYSLYKPNVNADSDLWGDHLNWNADTIDSVLFTASSGVTSFNTRTGAITLLSADVTGALGYTPYNATNPAGYQTAAQVAAIVPAPGTATPLMAGTPAVGTSLLYSRQDHIHGTDTTRVARAGDTMTGNLTIAPPTSYAAVTLIKIPGDTSAACQISGYRGNNVRWIMQPGTAETESGSNAGSNFAIYRYADDGSYLGSTFAITRSSGQVSIATTLGVTGMISTADQFYLTASGASFSSNGTYTWLSFDSGNNYRLQYQRSNAALAYVNGTGSGLFSCDASGNVWANGNLTASASVYAINTLYANSNSMVFGPGGNGKIMMFQNGYYWDFNTSNGYLTWTSNSAALWIMRTDNFTYNNLGPVGGHGPFVDLGSDERVKTSIAPATEGLAEVLQLDPIRYRRIKDLKTGTPEDRDDLGFGAGQVQDIMPEATYRIGIGFDGESDPDSPRLGLSVTPIVAAVVNAIKELHARIAHLEGHTT